MRFAPIAQALAVLATASLLATTPARAQDKPAELKIGISTFTSGAASVFGVPGKAAAELLIDEMNAKGGIGGVKVVPTFIDEGIGGDKLLSEYRRLVQEQGVKTMLSAISSGNCNIVAPVAEDLKVLNVMWDCGTEKILENKRFKYVVRTQANATTEMVATVLYLLKMKPNFNSIAVVNQDYAWGQSVSRTAKELLAARRPDIEIVGDELHPMGKVKDFAPYVTKIAASKADAVITGNWGNDLSLMVRAAKEAGLKVDFYALVGGLTGSPPS